MRQLTRRIMGIAVIVSLIALSIIAMNRLGMDDNIIRAKVEQLGIWTPLGLFTLRFKCRVSGPTVRGL